MNNCYQCRRGWKKPKHVFTLWNLRVNWEICSLLVPNWLKLDNCVIQSIVGKDQRLNWVKFARSRSGKWLEISRKSSCQKLECEKLLLARSRVCRQGRKCMLHAGWNVANYYEIWNMYVKGVERNKKIFKQIYSVWGYTVCNVEGHIHE